MARSGNRRGRVPRVEITYDLDVGGDRRRKELPFVIGVLGDFIGRPEQPPPRFRDRAFVEVSRETLNTTIKSFQPRLAFKVPNRLGSDDRELAVTLRFQKLEDFEPEQIASQVPALRGLIALRQQLVEARARSARAFPRGRHAVNSRAPERGR